MQKLFLLILPAFLLAAGAKSEPDYDIVARTINFLLFAGILYYLIANPIKNAYKARIEGIDKNLSQARKKIEEARAKEELAKSKVAKAKEDAARLIETARIEARQLTTKIERDTQASLISMYDSYEEQKEFTRRASTRKIVSDVLEEAFSDTSIKISEQGLVDLIKKKVS